MSVVLMFGGQMPIIKVERMAGQFAKPRSDAMEEKDGIKLPSYEGDNINGDAFTEKSRIPDPNKMSKAYTQSAATLNLLRWVYEGVIEDPYGEFFIAENKSLQKESLTQDYDAKYWQQRYSLKLCSFLSYYDLMGKLRSIKHYLLLDQGDFLVHFMDITWNELKKKFDDISVEKLQSLLDLALRSTAAAADPCHEDLTCCVEIY